MWNLLKKQKTKQNTQIPFGEKIEITVFFHSKIPSVDQETEAKLKQNKSLYWGVSGLSFLERRFQNAQKSVLPHRKNRVLGRKMERGQEPDLSQGGEVLTDQALLIYTWID